MNEKVIKHLSEAQLALARAVYYGEKDMLLDDVMMIRQCLNRIPSVIVRLEGEPLGEVQHAPKDQNEGPTQIKRFYGTP